MRNNGLPVEMAISLIDGIYISWPAIEYFNETKGDQWCGTKSSGEGTFFDSMLETYSSTYEKGCHARRKGNLCIQWDMQKSLLWFFEKLMW